MIILKKKVQESRADISGGDFKKAVNEIDSYVRRQLIFRFERNIDELTGDFSSLGEALSFIIKKGIDEGIQFVTKTSPMTDFKFLSEQNKEKLKEIAIYSLKKSL